MDDASEIEVKLLASPAMLEELRGCADLEGAETVTHLFATYFDTVEGRLGSNGATLRVREGPDGREQTLKIADRSGSAVHRNEWNVPIQDDAPDLARFSAPARTELDRLLDGAGVIPVAVSRIERTSRRVRFGHSSIEVAFDAGTVEAGGRSEAVRELELELVKGRLADVLGLASRLPVGPDLSWSVTSKAARAHALAFASAPGAVHAEPVRFAKQADASQGFRSIAWECLGQLLGNYPLVIARGDRESVHQARVAIRRLRAACSLFGDVIDDDQAPRLLAEMKAVAAGLGGVRDLDVMLSRLDDAARDTRKDVSALKELLETRRDVATSEARELLSGTSFQTLLFDFASWIENGAWRSANKADILACQPIEKFAAGSLARRTRKLCRKHKRVPEMTVGERHAMRTRIKKLRYAAEFFAGLFREEAMQKDKRRFLKALGKLQTSLGELNDLAVASSSRGALFTDVEPIAAAGLEVQFVQLLEGRPKQVRRLLKSTDKSILRLGDLPPWWKSEEASGS